MNLQQQDYSDISAKLPDAEDRLRPRRCATSRCTQGPRPRRRPTRTKLTATATGAAAASSYNVVVSNVARAAVMAADGVVRVSRFGTLYQASGAYASTATKLTALTTSTGAAAGYAVGDTITLNATQGGQPTTASYQVTDSSTVGDLANWLQGQLKGSSVSLQPPAAP